MTLADLSAPVKHSLDGGAALTFMLTIIGWLPQMAALLTVVWVILRIRLVRLEHRIAEQQFQINARKLAE